jgi:hypothetical protein
MAPKILLVSWGHPISQTKGARTIHQGNPSLGNGIEEINLYANIN